MDGIANTADSDFAVIAELTAEIERLRARLAEHEHTLSAIAEQDKHLTTARQAARIGYYSYDLETDELFWSDETYRIMGVEVGTPITTRSTLQYFHPDDREKVVQTTRQSIIERCSTTAEFRMLRPNGETGVQFVSTSVSLGPDGRVRKLFGVMQEITERRAADEALRASEEKFRATFEQAGIGMLISVPGEPLVAANPAFCKMLGFSEEELLRKSIRDLQHPDEIVEEDAERARIQMGIPPEQSVERRYLRKDGSTLWAIVNRVAIWKQDGTLDYIIAHLQDITERRANDEALRTSEEKFRKIFEYAGVGMLIAIPDGPILAANPAVCEMLGYTQKEMLSMAVKNLQHPDELERNNFERVRLLNDGVPPEQRIEKRYVRKDGSTIWAIVSRVVIWKDDGSIDYVISQLQDITDRKNAERALADSEQRFKDFANTAADRFWEMDADHRFTMILSGDSDRAVTDIDLMIGRRPWEVRGTDPDMPEWQAQIARLDAHVPWRDHRFFRFDPVGGIRWIRTSGTPIFDENGNFIGHRGTSVDETAEVEARQTAEITHQRFIDAVENAPESVTYWDAEGRFVMANSQFRGNNENVNAFLVPGIHIEEFIRRRLEAGAAYGVPEEISQDEVIAQLVEKFHEGNAELEFARDGRFYNNRVRRLEDGSTLIYQTDVTDAKRREEEHRQALKMDAVGKLTGGIAHDFNNHLAAILGNIELSAMELEKRGLPTARLERAMKSIDSARNLTKTLLAFSRKQTLRPVPIQLEKLVDETMDLLRRALGEHVEIETDFEANLWNIRADRNQLENALVNLAINARDAMESGGTLRVECRNVHRRPYGRSSFRPKLEEFVALSVIDSGCGIPAKDLDKVFDPFFTTKDFGAGSGLGLSQVYGFVTQSGGDVEIESTVGVGTTVTLWFPRSIGANVETEDRGRKEKVATGSGQRILVIEDDAEVRAATIAMLESFGYDIVDGGEGDAVEQLCERGKRCFDLILTDVVLRGGRNGPEVARHLTAANASTKVLLMTGYAQEDIELGDNTHLTYPIITKPFSARELAEKVRATLAA